jgi:hypothetical protein
MYRREEANSISDKGEEGEGQPPLVRHESSVKISLYEALSFVQ